MTTATSTGPHEGARTGGRSHGAPPLSHPRPDELLYVDICRAIDTPVAVLLLLAVFVATNVGTAAGAFQDFLAIRVTVKNLLLVAGFALAWRLACGGLGLYTWWKIRSARSEVTRVLILCSAMAATALVFPAISSTGAFRYATVGWFWVTIIPVMVGLRAVLRSLTASNVVPVKDILIIGSGPRAMGLYERLTNTPDHRRIVGFVDSVGESTPPAISDKLLGSLENLEGLLMHRAIDEVLIALPMKSRYSEIQEVIRVCERVGVRSKYLADIFELSRTTRTTPDSHAGVVDVPIASDDYRLLIKRVIDVVGGIIAIVVLSPIMLMAAIAIKLTSRGPAIYRQERYGYNRRKFSMLKFRTMVANAESLQAQFENQNEAAGPIFKIRHDPRMTPVGRFLRRTSIDELPQLVNVLWGEMSLVGPRPMATRDVHRFTEAALMRRFSVRPGITCLWQVSGRSNLGFDQWIKLDLQYIDQWSLALDASILARTVPAVMKGTGAA